MGPSRARVNYPVASSAYSVAVGDFNGDGKLDLAVANYNTNNVSILLGNGDGTFQAAVNRSTGSGPVSIAVGDFNGDGKLDLATANNNGNNVTILLGAGNGTFPVAHSYGVGSAPASIAVGDFNGDGKPDLAVANSGGGNVVSILLGYGDGTFQTAVNYGAGSNPYSVAVGDFNGDGKLDVAAANHSSANVSVLLGKGDGTFQTAVNYAAGTVPYSVAVGDFNGDGKPDLAVANYISSNVSIMLNNTPPAATRTTVTSSLNPALMGQTVTLTATVSGPGGTPTGTVQFMNGTTALGSPATLSGGQATYSTSWSTDGIYSIRAVYSGDSNFAASDSAPSVAAGTQPLAIAEGDFNGDGIPDFVTVDNTSSNNLFILLGAGGDSFTTPAGSPLTVGRNPGFVAVGDLNGDGKLDLAVAANNSNGTGSLYVLLGNGDGTFQAPVAYASSSIFPSSIKIADLNHDGKPDLILGAQDKVYVLLGNGDGTFQTPVGYAAGNGSDFITLGDFNGDGNLDVAAADIYDTTVSVLLGNGDGTFQTAAAYQTDGSPGAVATGDFNHDGKLDLVVANTNGGTGGTAAILLGNGDGTFQAAVTYPAGEAPIGVALADFNHDGNLDVAIPDYHHSDVNILMGNGDGTFQQAVPVPLARGHIADGVAVSDLNRDGNPDLAMANSYGTADFLLGDGTGAFSQSLTQTINAITTVRLSFPPPTFPATVVGQTSPPQNVTLTNTGSANLSIQSVGITGDFAIASNSCGAILAPKATCTVAITFSPTAVGTRTGTLTFTDDGSGNPQSYNLTGQGQDFSLTARTTSQTVSPGVTANFDLLLSPEGGFNQTVDLACSGAPQGSTCTVTPASVTLDGSNNASVGLKVTTTGNALLVPGDPGNMPPPSGGLPMAGWLAIFSLVAVAALAKFSPQGGRARRLAPFATLALLAMLAVACGGGNTSSSASSSSGTPAGTYTLTVTGKSGSATRTANVTLKVQ